MRIRQIKFHTEWESISTLLKDVHRRLPAATPVSGGFDGAEEKEADPVPADPFGAE